MEINLTNPHDQMFRATLSSQRRADAVLRAHLEPWLVDLLGEDPPVPLDGSFVDEELRGSQSDKLLRVRLRSGRRAYVYALLEHKSHPDANTPLQLWKYKLRIWNAYGHEPGEESQRLPSIVPVVFYHGRETWTAPRSVAEMVGRRTSVCGSWSRASASTCGTWGTYRLSASRRTRRRGPGCWRCATRMPGSR